MLCLCYVLVCFIKVMFCCRSVEQPSSWWHSPEQSVSLPLSWELYTAPVQREYMQPCRWSMPTAGCKVHRAGELRTSNIILTSLFWCSKKAGDVCGHQGVQTCNLYASSESSADFPWAPYVYSNQPCRARDASAGNPRPAINCHDVVIDMRCCCVLLAVSPVAV